MQRSNKGEEIFEYIEPGTDGNSVDLSNLQEQLIQKPWHNLHLNDSITSNSINPEDSFQAFNGKIFGIPSRSEYSIADSLDKRVESPLERFSRIKCELDQLKFDLDSAVQADDNGAPSIWSLLQRETNSLVESTRLLEKHKGLEMIRKNITSSDRVLEQLVESVKTLSVKENPFHSDKKKELTLSSTLSPDDLSVLALEKRICTLETLLGIQSNILDSDIAIAKPFSPSFPLIDSISRIEQRVSMLDGSNLDALKVKANNLRIELEAIVKAKSSNLPLESRALEASQRVDDLIEKVGKVESVADSLPSLVVRLKTLENVHKSANSFNNRLVGLEEEVSILTADLKSNKDVLTALKDGMSENISIMQKNLKQMDLQVTTLERYKI